jgi:four helix bundle protein
MAKLVSTYKDLRVYRRAMEAAIEIHQLSKRFPVEEKYSLTDQVRRSSRSVCTNLAEGWRKRRYRAAFIAKLNDAESEACETQVWLELARNYGFIDGSIHSALDNQYDLIMGQVVRMIEKADSWLIKERNSS